MKFRLLLLVLSVVFTTSCSAQGFFKPLPKPGSYKVGGKFGAVADSISTGIRPLIGVTATVSDGTTLAGGVGAGWQRNKYDFASQSWVMQYSVSALIFVDSKGDFIPAALFGFANGLFQIGGGYNTGTKKAVFITGVGIKLN